MFEVGGRADLQSWPRGLFFVLALLAVTTEIKDLLDLLCELVPGLDYGWLHGLGQQVHRATSRVQMFEQKTRDV